MFRPLRRTKNAISDDAAKQLLINEKRAVFAVNGDDGYPYAIPVNYFYDPDANKIFFHGAGAGHKFDALKKDDKVCFTVYGNETRSADDWAPYMQSVVVFGRCRVIEDAKVKHDRIRSLALKYYPTEQEVDEEIARDLHAARLYEITVEHLTGKQIHEK